MDYHSFTYPGWMHGWVGLRGGLGRLAAWHLPGVPAGLGREDSYSDKLFAWVPKFLVMSLLMGPGCLISQGQFEELVRPWLAWLADP